MNKFPIPTPEQIAEADHQFQSRSMFLTGLERLVAQLTALGVMGDEQAKPAPAPVPRYDDPLPQPASPTMTREELIAAAESIGMRWPVERPPNDPVLSEAVEQGYSNVAEYVEALKRWSQTYFAERNSAREAWHRAWIPDRITPALTDAVLDELAEKEVEKHNLRGIFIMRNAVKRWLKENGQ